MYLHENQELFKSLIAEVKSKTGYDSEIIEKDYYVTMILCLIVEKSADLGIVVFKGGTSLSKCHKVIDRFSEDIDITFTEHLGEKKRKKLKYNVMKALGDELHLSITNWDTIQSDRDLNAYIFYYEPLFNDKYEALIKGVKVETALASYSFPTEKLQINSYVGDTLLEKNAELARQFHLTPFTMNVQALSRTFIDKVYASCDYYMQGKSRRLSRHLYDLYKIFPKITFDDDFIKLVKEVKAHRASMSICPSAQNGINISELIQKYCSEDYYKKDFEIISETLINEDVSYSKVLGTIKIIASFDFW